MSNEKKVCVYVCRCGHRMERRYLRAPQTIRAFCNDYGYRVTMRRRS